MINSKLDYQSFDIIDMIETVMGDISSKSMIESGFIRVNGPDINLDIRIGTCFLDVVNRAIIVLGHPQKIEYFGGFEYIHISHKMQIVMGNQYVTVYLSEDDRVDACFDYYENEHQIDKNEEEGINNIH